MTFTVIDKKTGKEPTNRVIHNIAKKGYLMFMDIDQFFVGEDGSLVLADDCGNITYCDTERFEVIAEQEPKTEWIPVSKRLPTKEEYIANNGLFIVSDGNRTYAEYFDVYNSMKYFGEPTMYGFRVDRCVIAWMPLPEPYKESEGKE